MKNENKIAAAVGVVSCLGIAAVMGFWGFVIWAIYKLVVHFTR